VPKLRFIVVGSTKSSFLREGEIFYLKRLQRYAPTEWIETKPLKVVKGRSRDEIVRVEGRSIEKRYQPDDHVIALDLSGREYDSEGLAGWLETLSQKTKRLCFVIGGPLGLSEEILSGAADILSLSKLTLTHEMSRLVLLEQLYRAHTIIKGEKYHK